jgi:hypothetical protein
VQCTGPPGAVGSPRGSPSLAGYNPAYQIDDSEKAYIPQSDFELSEAQKEDADLGLYLDLATVKNPQPIRGSGYAPTVGDE